MALRFYYFNSTHWDREWYLPMENYRRYLVDTADGILKALENERGWVVILDERGENITSVEFAEKLNACDRKIVLVIGGAFGFTDEVRKRADYLLALSKFTVTHEMARFFLVEQLYRACTIIAGKKYHH